MSLEPIPLSRRRTLDAIEDAHNRALDLLDDPLVRPLDAIEWLSAHLSAASWTPSTPGRYRRRTLCGSRPGSPLDRVPRRSLVRGHRPRRPLERARRCAGLVATTAADVARQPGGG